MKIEVKEVDLLAMRKFRELTSGEDALKFLLSLDSNKSDLDIEKLGVLIYACHYSYCVMNKEKPMDLDTLLGNIDLFNESSENSLQNLIPRISPQIEATKGQNKANKKK